VDAAVEMDTPGSTRTSPAHFTDTRPVAGCVIVTVTHCDRSAGSEMAAKSNVTDTFGNCARLTWPSTNVSANAS
jgi:hypothetical protein